MKYFLPLLLIVIIALFSCTGGEDNVKVPADIISPDSMVVIIADFQLVEAAIQVKQQQGKDSHIYTGLYYKMILNKHNINRRLMEKSLDFYSDHPKLLQRIYNKVLNELSTIQSKTMQ